MAKVNICRFCSGSVVNKDSHPHCWCVFCEDLLAQIQIELKKTGGISEKLKGVINAEKFKTRDEAFGEQLTSNQRALRKKVWELDRMKALQKAAEEWEESHPNPDPVVY